MASPNKIVGLFLTLTLVACGGGIKVKGGSSAKKDGATQGSGPGGSGDTKQLSLQLTANTVDATVNASLTDYPRTFLQSLGLLSSTVMAPIFMRQMDVEILCGTGTAQKQISYTLAAFGLADNSLDATLGFVATFQGSVASNCDAATVIVDDVEGNFTSANGTAFKLTANGILNKYVFSGTSVTANLAAPIPLTVGSIIATFNFNKASDTAAGGDITAHSTASGTTQVNVTDGCAGTATITTIDPASFKVWVPQLLTNPVQSTIKVHDLTGATATYTQDGTNFNDPNPPGTAIGAQWTFDFSTAAYTDATVAYTMTVTGDGNQNCTANLTANVTTSGGTPILFPPATAVPPNPTNLTAQVISATEVDLSWTSGGVAATGFKVAYTTLGGAAPALCVASGTVTVVSVAASPAAATGLTTGTTYGFRVCAIDVGAHLSGGITIQETTP